MERVQHFCSILYVWLIRFYVLSQFVNLTTNYCIPANVQQHELTVHLPALQLRIWLGNQTTLGFTVRFSKRSYLE